MSLLATHARTSQAFAAAEWSPPYCTAAQRGSSTLSSDVVSGFGVCGEPSVVALSVRRPAAGLPTWADPVKQRLNHLLSLPANWDSYGAKCVDIRRAVQAFRVLAEVMVEHSPRPQIVPTSDGGVQLEWHQNGIDLEVEIAPSSKVLVSYEDSVSGSSWDGPLTHDRTRLAECLATLARRVVGV